jgi:DNA-binding transcriptional MerR regulator
MPKTYRIQDLAEKIDRSKLTVMRWEEQKVLPRAKRDSRGWRYYTEEDIKKIVKLVKKTGYFGKRR